MISCLQSTSGNRKRRKFLLLQVKIPMLVCCHLVTVTRIAKTKLSRLKNKQHRCNYLRMSRCKLPFSTCRVLHHKLLQQKTAWFCSQLQQGCCRPATLKRTPVMQRRKTSKPSHLLLADLHGLLLHLQLLKSKHSSACLGCILIAYAA